VEAELLSSALAALLPLKLLLQLQSALPTRPLSNVLASISMTLEADVVSTATADTRILPPLES